MIASQTNKPLDEALLISRAAGGHLQAFNELVLRYQDMLYHHAYALLEDEEEAADATQDGLIKAFESLGQFHGGSFRAWLLRIVSNMCYDRMRQRKRHPTLPLLPADEHDEELDSPAWLADPGPTPEQALEETELSASLYRLLDRLPVPWRTVLTLVDLYELDYAEAAAALQVPVGTVKSRLARARLRMRDLLREAASGNGARPYGSRASENTSMAVKFCELCAG